MASPKTSDIQLFLRLLSIASLSSASDTITRNKSLSGGQKLTSKGGQFELGFFQPDNSPYYYVGIWYSLNQVSQLAPVWVANSEIPLADHTTAELRISDDGNLILSNQTNPLIWSTNITTKSNSTMAVLLDSGNLVLTDGSNPNFTLCQSLDHLWIPSLTSSSGQVYYFAAGPTGASPWLYTYVIDTNGTSQYFICRNNSFSYWTSGLGIVHNFSATAEMTAKNMDSFPPMTAGSDCWLYDHAGEYECLWWDIMDVPGQIKRLTWMSNMEWIIFWSDLIKPCQVDAFCGPFSSCNEIAFPFCNCIKGFSEKTPYWSGGCVRNTQLQCSVNSSRQAEKDRFFTMSNIKLPYNPRVVPVGSDSDCELACLNDCSCIAYSYDRRGCFHWYGELLNLQDRYGGPDAGTISLRLAASELPNSKSNKGVIIVDVIGGAVGLLALLVAVWLLIWCRRRKGMMSKSKVAEGGLVAYRYGDLQRVTKNFSEKLGEGGFGSVFRGVLSDSTKIAVKKLVRLRQGEKQFRTEVSTIGTIHHVNLVRLCGFCSEGMHKLLVYEYMPNGSLDTHLFRNGEVLDWKTRYQIALGIARGLAYLHEQCRDCVIHCDIKPENILLEASFVPKVADFGLAKLIGRDFSRVLTTMRGTIGYLAPEWISGEAITAKVDVYSYGMMLFEIISGKRNSDQTGGNKNGYFPILAAHKLIEGDVISLLDSKLGGDADLEQVIATTKIACWCIQDDENSRPSMGRVVQSLEGIIEISMPPISRRLQMLTDNPESCSFSYRNILQISNTETSSSTSL